MATLGDLKQRIITETTRDDLADDLATSLNQIIADAIDFYAAEPWWFNQQRVSSTCVIGSEYIDRPAGMRIVNVPFLIIGGVRYDLTRRDMAYIEGLYTTPQTGQPTDYCEFVAQIRYWPTPPVAYTVVWLDSGDVAALDYTNDGSSSYWTNEGQALIRARSKFVLYRDFLSTTSADPRLALAENAMMEAYSRLKAESNRRLSSGKVTPGW